MTHRHSFVRWPAETCTVLILPIIILRVANGQYQLSPMCAA